MDTLDATQALLSASPRLKPAASAEAFDFIGRHFLASYLGCDPDRLRDLAGLKTAFERAVAASGATLMGSSDHVYPPYGYTLVCLLSESHASIHTYPEHNACFVDLFTCGLRCRPAPFDAVLRDYLRPAQRHSRKLIRSEKTEEE
jgi:S-adenosylmethionine decarboxylase